MLIYEKLYNGATNLPNDKCIKIYWNFWSILGHGGPRAAQYCKENLLKYVLQDPEFLGNPSVAMKNSFIRYLNER